MAKTTTGFDVLVIGAGICGLATAVALGRKGHQVRVLEQAAFMNDSGGSVTLLPTASRIIVALGLEKEFKKFVTPIRCFVSRDGATGEVIGHTACNMGNSAQINFDAEYWNINRADYQMLLAQAAKKYNVQIVFDAELVKIEYDHVRAICNDGRAFNADLIVGADGLNSRTRTLIPALSETQVHQWPEHSYRCTVNKDKMISNPLLETLLDPTKLDGNSYMMEGKYVITWPMRPGKPFEIIASVTEKDINTPAGTWSCKADPREVQAKFSDFCPQIIELLTHVDEIMKWSLGELPDLETWQSLKGTVVLAGDAAHGMIPHAASGPSSSVEDAAVLAETLTWAFDRGKSVSAATEAYERIRKPRTSKLQQLSRQHDGFLGAGGDAVKARNATLKELDTQMWETLKIPEDERRRAPKPKMDSSSPFPTQWLYGFNAIQDAKEQLGSFS